MVTDGPLYRETIESLLKEGYAPSYHGLKYGMDGKPLAVIRAAEILAKQGKCIIRAQGKTTVADWLWVQHRRQEAGKPNLVPDWNLYPPFAARLGRLSTDPVMPGFEISRVTTVEDAEGNKVKEFIQQRPQHDEPFELPPAHEIKGVSALLDSEGRVISKWVKTKEGYEDREIAIGAIKEAFNECTGQSPLIAAPKKVDTDLLTSYYIGDHHFGMFSWHEETGFNYDIKIGEKLLYDAMSDLVHASPLAETGLIVSLGDFFHTDTSFNMTPKSGNVLDVDNRRAKIYKVGVKLLTLCIELALTKHKHVTVRCLPGNHDPDTTPTLAIALWAFFHNNPRVSVDINPSRFFFYEFGSTMIAGTHGDMAKIQDMPTIMAMREPAMWGRTRFRYAVAGHVHHKEKICKEIGGVICETFQVLAPDDAWHAGMGFMPGRSMTAVTYDRRLGERIRYTSSIPYENDLAGHPLGE